MTDRPRLPSLGPRGEGWVVIQIALFAGIMAAGLVGAGIRSLGESLSPMPRPLGRAVLKQHGIYARVRHPIYGGVILLAVAWSLLSSPWAFIPTGALGVLLGMKARLEERWLAPSIGRR